MKKVLTVLMFLVLTMSLAFAAGNMEAADHSLEKVLASGKFVLGLDDSFPPMGYRNENNEIVGFDIDLAKEVCKIIGVQLVCQPIDWSAKELELNTGNIDCIWNGFTLTEERAKVMTFSKPYLANNQVVIVRSGSPIKSMADLAGKKIGVQAGSSGQDALDASEYKSKVTVVEFKDFLTAIMDLSIGGVDGVVIDSIVANEQIQGAGVKAVILPNSSLAAEDYAIGFRKADVALCDAVMNALNVMKSNGKLAEISNAWFGEDLTTI